ncbi:MAG: hypothetical protein ACP5J5_04660, partial [Dissulfurimicrobium sp.]
MAVLKQMTGIYIIIFSVLFFAPFLSCAEMVSVGKNENHAVAEVHGKFITIKDVVEFAKTSP